LRGQWIPRLRPSAISFDEAYRAERVLRTNLEDRFDAFLSAPIISCRDMEGVINVQHRDPYPHNGTEMELPTTVGEQVVCLLMLSCMESNVGDNSTELAFSVGPWVRGS
jgi:uroporphyrinogen-III synthase